ncbi:hypothetical protein GCM10027275_11170 [Rhabdobacter roseus]
MGVLYTNQYPKHNPYILMKANLSNPDRIWRIVLAVITVVLYATGVTTGLEGILVMVAGGILLLTSFVNYCPLYGLFGVSTKRKK